MRQLSSGDKDAAKRLPILDQLGNFRHARRQPV
jgi:hypothetical protein